MSKLSVIINTRNEEENLPRVLKSIKGFADELIVVDMDSSDKTVQIAKKAGAKVYLHKPTGYVEPARNFAISKATNEWILILDADEEIPESLKKKLKSIIQDPQADFYRIPRKNMIFNKWIEHTLWWPDYQIRFFRVGKVLWSELIHSVPETHGVGSDLPPEEQYAITHYNYQTVSQFLERLNRYTSIQAKVKLESDYEFFWSDIIKKPVSEFIRRYFEGEGYKDGLHGLALSLLQAFSELVVYLKVWEAKKFKQEGISDAEVKDALDIAGKEVEHWMVEKHLKHRGIVHKILRRLS